MNPMVERCAAEVSKVRLKVPTLALVSPTGR